jgi:hypothetical protein
MSNHANYEQALEMVMVVAQRMSAQQFDDGGGSQEHLLPR